MAVERLLTPRDVAERLQVSRAAVYKWTSEGRLRSLRAGHSLRYRPQDVDDFLRRGERPR